MAWENVLPRPHGGRQMFLPKMVRTPKVLAPLSRFKESYAVLCVFRVFGDLRAMLQK